MGLRVPGGYVTLAVPGRARRVWLMQQPVGRPWSPLMLQDPHGQ